MPDPPENVKCTGVGEDTATIIWEPPKFDGGVPIKGMILNHLFVRHPYRQTAEMNTGQGNRLAAGLKDENLCTVQMLYCIQTCKAELF